MTITSVLEQHGFSKEQTNPDFFMSLSRSKIDALNKEHNINFEKTLFLIPENFPFTSEYLSQQFRLPFKNRISFFDLFLDKKILTTNLLCNDSTGSRLIKRIASHELSYFCDCDLVSLSFTSYQFLIYTLYCNNMENFDTLADKVLLSMTSREFEKKLTFDESVLVAISIKEVLEFLLAINEAKHFNSHIEHRLYLTGKKGYSSFKNNTVQISTNINIKTLTKKLSGFFPSIGMIAEHGHNR